MSDETRTSANGYHYTREKGKWRLTHHIVAEEKIGRKIKKGERVYFKDKDRNNLDPDNIEVRPVRTKEDRIREIQNKIADLQTELKMLKGK